jgi:GT2 family glycosyltransferase
MSRPALSVIVPFAGSDAELTRLVAELESLQRRPGDELIIADNRTLTAPARTTGDVRLLGTGEVAAPGYARNRAAGAAGGEWLVFLDADTRPGGSLLDLYFDPPPRATTAVLAGGIADVPSSTSFAARHSAARSQMSHRVTLERRGTPYAQSANCAVRSSAFAAVGGFNERIRAGEDADLCFRLARAGWELEERPLAAVEHVTRGGMRALLAQLVLHGSGAAWLDARYPGEFPPPRPHELAARIAHAGRIVVPALMRGDRERAASAVLDLVTQNAFDLGRLRSNRARRI